MLVDCLTTTLSHWCHSLRCLINPWYKQRQAFSSKYIKWNLLKLAVLTLCADGFIFIHWARVIEVTVISYQVQTNWEKIVWSYPEEMSSLWSIWQLAYYVYTRKFTEMNVFLLISLYCVIYCIWHVKYNEQSQTVFAFTEITGDRGDGQQQQQKILINQIIIQINIKQQTKTSAINAHDIITCKWRLSST